MFVLRRVVRMLVISSALASRAVCPWIVCLCLRVHACKFDRLYWLKRRLVPVLNECAGVYERLRNVLSCSQAYRMISCIHEHLAVVIMFEDFVG
jgi:hypothetical protein